MPKAVRTKKQAQFEKRALRKLQSTGLYSGKIDLRKAPNSYQQKLLKKYADVISGSATVVRPKNPKRYKAVFRTVGDAVIVPRRKGETISVKGEDIVSKRKVGKRTVKSKYAPVPKGERVKRAPAKKQYVVPFAAPNGGTNWQRFPDYDTLAKFMEGYNYKDWPNYVIEENIDNELDDDELQERLDRQLAKKRRKPRGAKKRKVRRK